MCAIVRARERVQDRHIAGPTLRQNGPAILLISDQAPLNRHCIDSLFDTTVLENRCDCPVADILLCLVRSCFPTWFEYLGRLGWNGLIVSGWMSCSPPHSRFPSLVRTVLRRHPFRPSPRSVRSCSVEGRPTICRGHVPDRHRRLRPASTKGVVDVRVSDGGQRGTGGVHRDRYLWEKQQAEVREKRSVSQKFQKCQ